MDPVVAATRRARALAAALGEPVYVFAGLDDEPPGAAGADGGLIVERSPDPRDPRAVYATLGLAVAALLADGHAVPLLRVARPDGTVAAIADPAAAGARLLARYAAELARWREAAPVAPPTPPGRTPCPTSAP